MPRQIKHDFQHLGRIEAAVDHSEVQPYHAHAAADHETLLREAVMRTRVRPEDAYKTRSPLWLHVGSVTDALNSRVACWRHGLCRHELALPAAKDGGSMRDAHDRAVHAHNWRTVCYHPATWRPRRPRQQPRPLTRRSTSVARRSRLQADGRIWHTAQTLGEELA